MVTLCWAAKGGSGTTVVATALALSSPRPSLLVDLDGEIPAVLGLPEPDRPGVAEWLASDASADHLAELLIDIGPRTWLLPWQSATADTRRDASGEYDLRWCTLGDWLHDWSNQWGCEVTVDVGTRTPDEPLATRADRSLLVTRPCYLSLRRAMRSAARPTGVILIDEPGHGLGQRDVEHALGVPVEAVVALDPSVSRSVDAGLLAHRLPRVMTRALRRVAA
jgi:hypothetical protein